MEADTAKLEAQLKRWSRRINGLATTANGAAAQTTIEHRFDIDDLKAKRAVAETLVDEFKKAGVSKWPEHQAGIEQAWDDVENALRKLRP